MSLKCLTWAWEQEGIVNQTDLLVLLALADHAGDKNDCYPSQATLARKARCSVDTVQRSLLRLEADRYITRKPRGASTGGRISDLYQLHLDRVAMNTSATGTSPSKLGRKMRLNPKNPVQPGDNQGVEPQVKPQSGGGLNRTIGAVGTFEPSEPPLHLDLGSEDAERQPPPAPAKPMLVIRPDCAAWKAWMQHLDKLGRSDVKELCIKHSVIRATQLWPKGDLLPLRL